MLAQQQKLMLSSYSGLYDLIFPKDNLLRKISELIDFTFIYQELVDKYYSNNGRTVRSVRLSGGTSRNPKSAAAKKQGDYVLF